MSNKKSKTSYGATVVLFTESNVHHLTDLFRSQVSSWISSINSMDWMSLSRCFKKTKSTMKPQRKVKWNKTQMKQKHSDFEKNKDQGNKTNNSFTPKRNCAFRWHLIDRMRDAPRQRRGGITWSSYVGCFGWVFLLPNHWGFNVVRNLHSLKLTNNPWKWMVGRWNVLLGYPIFRGELLLLGRVYDKKS